MSNTKFCLFCENKGLKSPHDHTVRDFKKKDKPIICPELLKNKCTYCHANGHTKYYCEKLKQKKIKKEKELIAALEKNNIKNPVIENLKKRVREHENGDDDLNEHINKVLKSNLLTCFVGGMTIDECEKKN